MPSSTRSTARPCARSGSRATATSCAAGPTAAPRGQVGGFLITERAEHRVGHAPDRGAHRRWRRRLRRRTAGDPAPGRRSRRRDSDRDPARPGGGPPGRAQGGPPPGRRPAAAAGAAQGRRPGRPGRRGRAGRVGRHIRRPVRVDRGDEGRRPGSSWAAAQRGHRPRAGCRRAAALRDRLATTSSRAASPPATSSSRPSPTIDGRGGGRPEMAQGKGTRRDGLAAALRRSRSRPGRQPPWRAEPEASGDLPAPDLESRRRTGPGRLHGARRRHRVRQGPRVRDRPDGHRRGQGRRSQAPGPVAHAVGDGGRHRGGRRQLLDRPPGSRGDGRLPADPGRHRDRRRAGQGLHHDPGPGAQEARPADHRVRAPEADRHASSRRPCARPSGRSPGRPACPTSTSGWSMRR